MATAITSSQFPYSATVSLNTDSFRTMVRAIKYLFSASGMINTNASGSADANTISSSVANGTTGYDVYRFNDELHNSGGKPVFVKVEYGTPVNQYWGGFFITVGFFHDGSGSISPTNTVGAGSTPRIAVGAGQGDNVTWYNSRMCSISGSELVGYLQETNTAGATYNGGGIFSVERTKDINGNVTGDGVLVRGTISGGQGNSYTYRESYLWYGPNSQSQVPPTETYYMSLHSSYTAVHNNTMTIGLLIPMLTGSYGYPSRMLGIVNNSSLQVGVTHNITLFNTQSVYYVVNTNTAERMNGTGTAQSAKWLMRYE
jgi:hypothetical protein